MRSRMDYCAMANLRSFKDRSLLFTFGRQYVLSLARAERCLKYLSTSNVARASETLSWFETQFPYVAAVRDSVAHADERMRRTARVQSRSVRLQGPVHLENATDSSFECTVATGETRGVVVAPGLVTRLARMIDAIPVRDVPGTAAS